MGYGVGERFQFSVNSLQRGGALRDALLQFLVQPLDRFSCSRELAAAGGSAMSSSPPTYVGRVGTNSTNG